MANNNRGRVPEQERCRGTSRQSKERCKRRRSPGSEYCIYHGGRVPKGGAHPNFKDGRRSRYMPPPLVENYERYFNDPDLTHHRDSIALVDVMVEEALGDWEGGGTPELWRSLEAAWRRVEKARAGGDAARLGAALDEAGSLIGRGARQTQRTTRVVNLLEQRRKHAAAETKRSLAAEGNFTYEMAAAYYTALGAAARRHFSHDRKRLTAFLDEVVAIAGGRCPSSLRGCWVPNTGRDRECRVYYRKRRRATGWCPVTPTLVPILLPCRYMRVLCNNTAPFLYYNRHERYAEPLWR